MAFASRTGLPAGAVMRYSVVGANQTVVAGGIVRASATGTLGLPPFEFTPPAVAFVRVQQED